MAKKINISLSETERENVRKVLEICNLLREYRGKDLKYDEVVTATKAIRTLLGDKIVGSLLERVGLRNMRFLNTARPIIATSDYNIVGSNYTITNVRLPLLEKKVRDGQLVEVIPLYKQPDKIKQSAAIDVAEWYSRTIVYLGNDLSLDRQETLQLLDGYAKGDKKAIDICGNMMANSGIYHMGLKLIFASMPIVAMAEQIIYEVAESLHIEGILDISDENELAQHLHLGNELFISHITINNYRLYKGEQEFNFQNRFTVLIGDNAKGKTTILDAIRVILDSIIPTHRMESKKGIKSGIHTKFSLSSVHREISEDGGLDYSWPVEISADSCYGQINRRRKSRENHSTKKYNKSLLDELKRLPLIVYCGVERTSPLETRKIEEKFSGDRHDAYYECLNTRTSSTYLKLWLRDLQRSARTNDKADSKADNKAAVLLSSFIDAVCSCLKDEHITYIEYVYQETKASDGKMDKIDDIVLTQRDPETENEKRMLFGTLSAGYRVMIGLIANLAYRCIILNPQLGKDAITGTSGIVLIDEIDMHLHPLWQRHIVEDLMRCFPKIQFVATTHSPFVVQSLNAEQIINLNNRPIMHNPTNSNLATNALYMGVDSDRSIRFREEENSAYDFLKAIKDKNVTAEKIDKLMKEYAIRHSDNPIYVAKLKIEANLAKNDALYTQYIKENSHATNR